MSQDGMQKGFEKWKEMRGKGKTEKRIDVIKECYNRFKAAFPDTPWPQAEVSPLPKRTSPAAKYQDGMMNVMEGREVYMLHNGHLMIGPKGLRNSDMVMLIKGAQVQYVLVPAKSIWTRKAEELERNIKARSRSNKRVS